MATNAPLALTPLTVTFLLSYLSRLDDPLPPHLISAPLRQRHHFLGLGRVLDTTQDAAAYLSWPSAAASEDDPQRVINLLGALPSAENIDSLGAYTIKYSCDGDAVYAHAQVPIDGPKDDDSTGLRLVFRWEANDGDGQGCGVSSTSAENWKYHDAKLMPFSPNCYNSPKEALHSLLPSGVNKISSAQISQSPSIRLPPTPEAKPFHAAASVDSEDDAYWNLYGRSNSDDEDAEGRTLKCTCAAANKETVEKAEEAYWAQYASVHGTADSTRHSPLPQKHKLHDPSQPVAVHGSADCLPYFDIYGGQELLAPDAYRPSVDDPYSVEHIEYLRHFSPGREGSPVKGTPSPIDLSRRLHNISPRVNLTPSPAPPDLDAERIRLEQLALDDLSSPDAISPETSDGQTLTPPGGNTDAIPEMALFASSVPTQKDGADSGLQETITGVYRLWTARRKQDGGHNAPDQKNEFVDIVRKALDSI